ncbi:lipoprotein NlpI [Aquisphaera giovannonii]|uniref:Lipoprotein NlpI n=1 Tax=Aquisphaera giovannonii TaxID=406548 RepID=A0A5B9W7P4_9BACT|nr:tetratricopeptide repeat protein [Aquisphaera giovannonii]QEH36367.1 lipoprotein NlpI [Aquisphaera giovannonii]
MRDSTTIADPPASPTNRVRGPGAALLAALAACVAVAAPPSVAGPPGRKDAQAGPPASTEAGEPRTVSVDVGRLQDPDAFKKDVTPAQRVHTHMDLGRALEISGEPEAALSEYQQALAACEPRGLGRSRSAEEALAHRRIAGVLGRLGRFAQAEVHYKKALGLSPKDPKIWNDAGYSYYLQGRYADAERALKAALKLAPEDERASTNLGLTLAASGRIGEAMPLLSRYSGDAIGHANLGYLLAATGRVELARQQYLQALALRPNLAVAHQALAKLDRMADGSPVAAATAPAADPAVTRTAAARPSIPPPVRFADPAAGSPPATAPISTPSRTPPRRFTLRRPASR